MPHETRYAQTSRRLETARGTLHYHEAGDGPPLLCLHGSGPGVSAWANFSGNLDTFAERFRVLLLDFPGFGASEPTDEHPGIAAPRAVLDFMEAMEIEKASILGNSMGGGVGARIAAEHPEKVARLATIGGVGLALYSPFPSEGVQRLIEFTEDPTRERLVAWLHSMVFDPALLTEKLIEERWRLATSPEHLAWARKLYTREAFLARTSKSTAPPAWTLLSNIQAPTLVTWGRDDRVGPVDMIGLPMRLIPRCEVHIFPNCGHWAMIECKDEFERVTTEFLSRDLPAVAL